MRVHRRMGLAVIGVVLSVCGSGQAAEDFNVKVAPGETEMLAVARPPLTVNVPAVTVVAPE